MSGQCGCRHCAVSAPAAVDETPEPQPIELPTAPTPIRVHAATYPPMDCTLHPDGALTRLVNGETLRNFMSLADMQDRGWKHARIEFNPGPLTEQPEPKPTAEAVQDAIPLTA